MQDLLNDTLGEDVRTRSLCRRRIDGRSRSGTRPRLCAGLRGRWRNLLGFRCRSHGPFSRMLEDTELCLQCCVEFCVVVDVDASVGQTFAKVGLSDIATLI